MRWRIGLAVSVLLLVGCESAEAKDERLRHDLNLAGLSVLHWQIKADSLNRELARERRFGNGVSNKGTLDRLDSALAVVDSQLTVATAKHDIAQRAFNKFMEGR